MHTILHWKVLIVVLHVHHISYLFISSADSSGMRLLSNVWPKPILKAQKGCKRQFAKALFSQKNQCISLLLLKLALFQTAEDCETIQHSNLTYKQQKTSSVCVWSQLHSLNVLICRPALCVWAERWPTAQLYPTWSHWKESVIGLQALDRGPELWRYPEKTSVDFRSVPLLPHMERRPGASLAL